MPHYGASGERHGEVDDGICRVSWPGRMSREVADRSGLENRRAIAWRIVRVREYEHGWRDGRDSWHSALREYGACRRRYYIASASSFKMGSVKCDVWRENTRNEGEERVPTFFAL